ncbi:hypothetical protein MKW98_018638 [Papaver atlanticum]|uniref:Trafficking protein particle complex subunit 11 domain-containing protein n=1 Tax=Papaver atlanticum TaxID=357466 RepID=A0AAD4T2U8_9MAGN|nr:hypothetical protein MKW98_018638 [Papaver atlanticum]
MEDYGEELRTPPVSLVSLVGLPELHSTISAYLHSEQPPINTLALPDFSKISIISKTQKETLDSSTHHPGGILKKDWLLKHRTKIPSVVAALFGSDHVFGDPTQWLQVCTDLDNLKAAVRARNIKLIVVIVQSSVKDEASEDRMTALRKRAEIDSKYLLIFAQNDSSELKESLNRLGSIFAELANTYYRDEGRRIKTRIEKKNINFMELNVRYCFKVAVYAEFRRDWVEALRFYEEAYHTLREMIGVSTRLPPIQRLVEIKTVAEQLHFKVSTLLLHGGKVLEAMTWFKKHIACYKKLIGAPEVVFLHWEWVSRQFLVFAQLLETCSASIPNTASFPPGMLERSLTEWEFYPAYYYQLAAHYLREKRFCLELALSAPETSAVPTGKEITSGSESVIPSVYVGQFARLLEQGDALEMHLADTEYVLYALAEGKRFQDSYEIIALFKKSSESYSSLKAQRMACCCRNLMAIEYFALSDFSNAKHLFDGVASYYRQEGWVTLLWEALGYMRECSRRLKSVKDFIEYSFEMAALPVASGNETQPSEGKGKCGPTCPATLAQREKIHNEVIGLVKGAPLPSSNLEVTVDQPLHLEIDLVSPLRAVLLASVAFHDTVVKPGSSTLFTLSLLSQLPHPVEIDQLEIQFNQPICNFTITNAQKPQIGSTSSEQVSRTEIAPALALITNKWLRLTYDIKSEQSGKLECVSVTARMGPHFSICCRAESPASMEDLPLWKFEDCVETFPTKDPALSFSGQKVIQVDELDPQVDLLLEATGSALVGERFMVPVTVVSKGHAVHSAELKINLVDARGGGLVSPRETEPSSMDSHHVQLLNVWGPNGEDESQMGPDEIRNIQQSFGLLSVPFLSIGESWSCKLEIKWHKPKPVMLYVSLGYLSNDNEASANKVNIHKSLQIEGKTAFAIGHQLMLPFRRDPLLLTKIKAAPGPDQLATLAFKEKNILIVSAKNCAEIPLRLVSISIEAGKDEIDQSCTVQQGCGSSPKDLPLLVPGEEFKHVFSVIPEVDSPKLGLGEVCLTWMRESNLEEQSPVSSTTGVEAGVLTRHKLPDVNVELAPLVVSLECPPHGILGDPLTCYVRIQNQTKLLQEIKYSLADSQSFLLSGSHNDTIFILPKSEHILTYRLVPLSSGPQQLPRVTVTSVRYSAALQPSVTASTVFIFPSKPHLKMDSEAIRKTELIATS